MNEERGLRAHRLATTLALAVLLLAPPMLSTSGLATHAGNHPASKGNVDNRAPDAAAIDLSGEDDDGAAGVQVNPSAGTTRTLDLSVEAKDGNGHSDVRWINVTVYEPDNATVHVPETPGTNSAGNGRKATFAASVDMEHWHAPGTYHVKATATDRDGATVTTWTTFEYQELAATEPDTSTVSFDDGDEDGKLRPGAETHSSPVNVSLQNAGNVDVDLTFNGTNLTRDAGGVIQSTDVHLDVDQDEDFSTNEMELREQKQTVTDFNLSASTDGTKSSAYVLFAIHVPNVPPGDYKGSLTLEAVKS